MVELLVIEHPLISRSGDRHEDRLSGKSGESLNRFDELPRAALADAGARDAQPIDSRLCRNLVVV
jgi:hypothetical protein